MLSQDLIALLQARRFAEAAQAIRTEKPRLKSVSLSHPVFHLLREHVSSQFNSFSGGYHGLDEGQRQMLRHQMEDVLVAMIEGGMDMKMLAEPPKTMSYQEEERSVLGLGFADQRKRFDADNATLYVRLVGVGWTGGMRILLDHGYKPDIDEVDAAVINAVRTEQEKAIVQLLATHDVGVKKNWYFSAQMFERLAKWEGVPAVIVSSLMDAFSAPRSHGWVHDAHDGKACDKTSVEWLSLQPRRWLSFHSELLEGEVSREKDKPSTGLWTALCRQFVQEGEFAPLLKEAFSDGSFNAWRDRNFCAGGVGLASWLAQGGALDPPSPRVLNYMGEMPPETPPQKTLLAQLRRTVQLVRMLDKMNCSLRMGELHDETEAMSWSARGFVPTASFVHRHPEVLLPSKLGSSPLHAANSVEVALEWEARGSSSAPNASGEDPWVVGMQKDTSPAPWAREIANRIKSGQMPLSSMGSASSSLSVISTKSPPLARLILKKSKSPPSSEMMTAAVSNHQFGLVKEWVDAGHLDAIPSLRPAVLGLVCNPPFGMTDAATNAWKSVLDSVRARPEKPWPEQVSVWSDLVDLGWNRNSQSQIQLFKEGLFVLSDWGPNARNSWGDEQWDMLPSMVRNFSHWNMALPIELTAEEGVKLFWNLLLCDEEGATRSTRLTSARKVWEHFDRALPVSMGGPQQFNIMRELDESQSSGGWIDPSPGFMQFLEAEELSAGLALERPTARAPGRRL